MVSFKLVCSSGSDKAVRELLTSNGIALNEESPFVICEEGVLHEQDCDVLIRFKRQSLESLIKLLCGIGPREPATITGISDDGFVILELVQIAFFNAYGNDTYANTSDGSCYKIRLRLYELEESVLPRYFIRINKSEIVNLKHVKKICPMFKGKLILKMQGCQNPLDISRSYTKAFKERIGL